MIQVIGPDDELWQPTKKYGWVYKKLLEGDAYVVRQNPFTIRLKVKKTEKKIQKEEQIKVPSSDRSRRNNENKRRLARFEAIKEKLRLML